MNGDISTINYSYLLGASDYKVSIYRHNERLFPFVSLTHVNEGEFYCEYGGGTFVAKKGETMYIPEGVLHNVYTLSPAMACWGHVSATSYRYDVMKNARAPVVIRGESSYTIKRLLDVLAEIKYDTVYALYIKEQSVSQIQRDRRHVAYGLYTRREDKSFLLSPYGRAYQPPDRRKIKHQR